MINKEMLMQLLDYDPESGIFIRKVSSKRSPAGAITGTVAKSGYVVITLKSRTYLAHRLAWLYTYGSFPNKDIDHIDGCRANNKIKNLRLASTSENAQNQKSDRRNQTGLLGVYHCRGKFIAQITVNGVRHSLGTFPDPKSAHEAYIAAKHELHPYASVHALPHVESVPPAAR